MKVIRYTRDGVAAIVRPYGRREGETEDEHIARVQAKAIPDGATDIEVIDDSVIPADRSGRGKWRSTPGGVIVT